MKTFRLKLLAADKVFFDGECASLVAPAVDGQYGILAGHCNAVVAVVPGVAELTPPDVENGSVLMLVEACENGRDVNEAWAKSALDEARDELARKESRFNALSAEIKIARALNRLKARDHVN